MISDELIEKTARACFDELNSHGQFDREGYHNKVIHRNMRHHAIQILKWKFVAASVDEFLVS